ncbi:glycosyltransferase, partial [Patescibacteria group bacterium]
MRNKPTLTIGISALNEELNIENILGSLVKQNEDVIDIAEIIVVSDGSNDKTVELANKLVDRRIVVIEENKRLGKNKRIEQICKVAKGEIIVLIDADVLPEDEYTIGNIAKPFMDDEKIAYVAGGSISMEPSNFVEKSVIIGRSVWDSIRTELKDGNGVYACNGRFYALRSEFAKNV